MVYFVENFRLLKVKIFTVKLKHKGYKRPC
jgi:hypothetical protein